jgi:hypothetical protein
MLPVVVDEPSNGFKAFAELAKLAMLFVVAAEVVLIAR